MSESFESILSRMKERMPEGISTMEGTFAGDILQATAAEIARIWSQEVDTVTQRGFIATAEGEWLDAACGDFGISRKNGESDDTLRKRALARIRNRGAGGSAADYAAWATEIEGVQSALVVPLGRGNGTVDVYIAAEDDEDEDLQSVVQAYLEERRPVGADVEVICAQPMEVDLSATVTRLDDTEMEDIQTEVSRRLRDYLQGVQLCAGGQSISLNRMIGLLMDCKGVADVSDVTMNDAAQNLTVPQGKYPVPGEVTLTEE